LANRIRGPLTERKPWGLRGWKPPETLGRHGGRRDPRIAMVVVSLRISVGPERPFTGFSGWLDVGASGKELAAGPGVEALGGCQPN
jgi:hypothetical protein